MPRAPAVAQKASSLAYHSIVHHPTKKLRADSTSSSASSSACAAHTKGGKKTAAALLQADCGVGAKGMTCDEKSLLFVGSIGAADVAPAFAWGEGGGAGYFPHYLDNNEEEGIDHNDGDGDAAGGAAMAGVRDPPLPLSSAAVGRPPLHSNTTAASVQTATHGQQPCVMPVTASTVSSSGTLRRLLNTVGGSNGNSKGRQQYPSAAAAAAALRDPFGCDSNDDASYEYPTSAAVPPPPHNVGNHKMVVVGASAPLPPHLSYLDEADDDASAGVSNAGAGAGAGGGSSGQFFQSCTSSVATTAATAAASYVRSAVPPPETTVPHTFDTAINISGGGNGGESEWLEQQHHSSSFIVTAGCGHSGYTEDHRVTLQDGTAASADAALLAEAFGPDGALAFSMLSAEGEALVSSAHFAARRRTLDRIAMRNVPDDRLRLSCIAARMAVRMLVSYEAFGLKGFPSFIVDDPREWERCVRGRRGLSASQQELLLTSDVALSGGGNAFSVSSLPSSFPHSPVAYFTSRSGTRSFIQVLFDAFAQSVKFFTEPITFFAALCYLDRIHAHYYASLVNGLSGPDSPPPMRVFKRHYLRLFATLMVVACKMHADLKSTVHYYMRNVPGVGRCGLAPAEMVRYEADVLAALGYNAATEKTHVASLLASFAAPDEKEMVENLLYY